MFFVLHSI